MSEAAAAAEAPGAAPRGNKLMVIVLVFNVLIAGGLGYLVAFGGIGGGHAEGKIAEGEHDKDKKEHVELGPLLEVGSLVVNLPSAEGAHYLKITVHIEVANDDVAKHLEHAMVPMRSEALLIFSGLTEKDVVGPDKIKALSEMLLKRIQHFGKKDEIRKVYFSEFVVQ